MTLDTHEDSKMLRKLFRAASVLPLRTTTALFAFHSVFLAGAGAASACTPVAYLFRHAEDVNQVKSEPFGLTLSTSGVAHADLYIGMIDKFQQEKPQYCPIRAVYALNPIKSDGSWGTSNPYWTADPLAQTAETTMQDRNAIISVQGMKLTEFLDHGEGAKFLEEIKGKINNQQSVAIFWTSQGMCKVATTLGPALPGYDCVASKPPRNSFFRFNYNLATQVFNTITTKYTQCFNYNANGDSFTPNIYYCQFSYNLTDWKDKVGFKNNLQQIEGRICDTSAPDPTCKLSGRSSPWSNHRSSRRVKPLRP
jgi:hypothetical protein